MEFERNIIEIPNEESVSNYYKIRQQLKKLETEMLQFIHKVGSFTKSPFIPTLFGGYNFFLFLEPCIHFYTNFINLITVFMAYLI